MEEVSMKRIFSIILATILMCSLLVVGVKAVEDISDTNMTYTTHSLTSSPDSRYVDDNITIKGAYYAALFYQEDDRFINGYNEVLSNTTLTAKAIDLHGNSLSVELYVYKPMQSGTYEKVASLALNSTGSFIPFGEGEPVLLTNGKTMSFTLPMSQYEEGSLFQVNLYIDGLNDGMGSLSSYFYRRADLEENSQFNDEKVTATPTASKVLVNGKEISFDAYTINQNNYFKLRDIASVLSGTNKQFEVTWNGEKGAIEMLSNQAYTSVGGELAAGDGLSKTPVLNTAKVYLDGKEVNLTAYTINGNNYFKLRDLGQLFNFGVSWNGAVVIDTSTGYADDTNNSNPSVEGTTKTEEELEQAREHTQEWADKIGGTTDPAAPGGIDPGDNPNINW